MKGSKFGMGLLFTRFLVFSFFVVLPSAVLADDSAVCDPSGMYPCSNNYVGMVILIAFYGAVLSFGAKLISDGSELMLELFPKWGSVIGALLLPILGAVPDAAIIIVSGALGTKEEAQYQLSVGVGTLAGSTIMLLTVPWAASLILARCDLNSFGAAQDKKCNGFSFTKQGISVDDDTKINARIMLGTSFAYLIIQIVAFLYLSDPSGAAARKVEGPTALAGFIACSIGLVAYCVYQVLIPKLTEKRKEKLEKEREQKIMRHRALLTLKQFQKQANITAPAPSSPDETNAIAFKFGQKWKAKVDEKKKEEEALLVNASNQKEDEDDDEEEGEENLAEHFKKNLFKSIVLLVLGTAVVAFFSDPMVEVISDFATKAAIKPFFVSFIITPYCSNASELISSLVFASKKRKENTSLTYSQLYGAATMNNTLCLGIFYALVAFRGLVWEFTAETVTILLVTWIIGLIAAFKNDFKVFWLFPVLSLYPFSVFFVWLLEHFAKWA